MSDSGALEAFRLLGVAPFLWSDEASLAQLQKRFVKLSRLHHPDLLVDPTDAEREAAESQSAALNGAWRGLKDFDSRLDLVLDSESPASEAAKAAAPAMALRWFELQEALADGEAGAAQQIADFSKEVEAGMAQQRTQLTQLAARYPLQVSEEAKASAPAPWKAQDLAPLREARNALRYLQRLSEDLARVRR